ncbi:NAD(P)H-dependent glycerol-3-phosphate dehydrogenase [Aneurinibacillus sp. Ricciae_BoGa-3]|uniref:NAD(P)H-dependent glycerol-3-phosphate dehydrogenase n=1 Tax=Aneurinibacillus sp. Ricciae_BoGa-3 TaxID=3022697 RepID=UPI002340B7D5|nr:NAD(P)H-dependent glycerol-3-phosphate dehydrogenase [Aneurinibacillus sp. Ricciae_BoGa-3]WCK56068.1 NAD(P)H-dependent glycerol-3-phosphate dehydrogenase [Aneurinibacillus sp. Ricciae_BoGa-3]
MEQQQRDVCVIGAGSWGTALATVLADNFPAVHMWARRPELAREINEKHENVRYLPGVVLPSRIVCMDSLAEALKDKTFILLVVPSHAMRETVRAMAPFLREDAIIAHATKGIEIDTLKRMSEVIKEELPVALRSRVAVVSGPSHAEEVGLKSPTTVVAAADDLSIAEQVQDILMTSLFRVYTNPDVVGVEIGGSLKNIIALAAGLSDGLGFGDNVKAALLTRGLAEIGRLGIVSGANPLTFSGLAGLGDLVVTATSRHSRNWRAGQMIAQGLTVSEILQKMGMVVEGIKTTQAVYKIAKERNVEMPITRELYSVLFEGKSAREAVGDLMGRVRRHEMEEVAIDYFSSHGK